MCYIPSLRCVYDNVISKGDDLCLTRDEVGENKEFLTNKVFSYLG